MIHSDGGGRSFEISSSCGNCDGFANSSDGGLNANVLLLPLVDAFDLCLVLLLLLLVLLVPPVDDVVAMDNDESIVELLLIDLLVLGTAAVIDTLFDLDEVLMGCSIPKIYVNKKKHIQTNQSINLNFQKGRKQLPSASAKLVPIELSISIPSSAFRYFDLDDFFSSFLDDDEDVVVFELCESFLCFLCGDSLKSSVSRARLCLLWLLCAFSLLLECDVW